MKNLANQLFKILLVGNPNVGKTTFFNNLTKSDEHVGNWHGVTVDSKQKNITIKNKQISVVDLPGIYSLSPMEYEEQIATDYVLNNNELVINIVDSNKMGKNLYLNYELSQINRRCIILINKTNNNTKIKDINTLSKKLNQTIVYMDAKDKTQMKFFKEFLCLYIKNKSFCKNDVFCVDLTKLNNKNVKNNKFLALNNLNYKKLKSIIKNKSKLKLINKLLKSTNIIKINKYKLSYNKINQFKTSVVSNNNHNILDDVSDEYKFVCNIIKIYTSKNLDFYCQKILEGDTDYYFDFLKISDDDKNKILNYLNKNNHNFANFLIKNSTIKNNQINSILNWHIIKQNKSSKLDKIFLNKFLGIPIFFGILILIFYLTFFSVGRFLSDQVLYFVQNIFGGCLNKLVSGLTNNFIVQDFFNTAIIGGVGSILSFLPQVVLLFMFLEILEDSGYLSRIAFLLDDILQKVGLSGKSVYTLLMGFGCSTTACLTARNMENTNSKTKTAMLAPYMSCSAKLPVYVVIGGAFFGASNVFVIFALYMLGVVVALILSMFWDKTYLKSQNQTFIMEFADIKVCPIKRIVFFILQNAKTFLVRIGSVLISVNIIVWVISSFSFSFKFVPTQGGKSIIMCVGEFLSPLFKPLGFGNWGATSALVLGVIAKEIIISSIAMFNGIAGEGEVNGKISDSLTLASSAVWFTPASALSYLVFCLLYTPCIASISVLRAEIGKKWTWISIFVQFIVAYITSFIIYNLFKFATIYGVFNLIFISIIFIVVICLTISIFSTKNKKCKHNCLNCKNKC